MYDEVHSESICSALTTDDKACGNKIAAKKRYKHEVNKTSYNHYIRVLPLFKMKR